MVFGFKKKDAFDKKQFKLLKQGVDVWNEWREDNPEESIDLKMANLVHVNLRGANLIRADLTGAELSGSILSRADLRWVCFRGATLRETDLSRANLTGAYSSDPNLSTLPNDYVDFYGESRHRLGRRE